MLKNIILICSIVLLISCTFEESSFLENNSSDVTNTDNVTPVDNTITLPGRCREEWVCISSIISAFRNSDCEFTNRTTCEVGCENGSCKEKEILTCMPGFKCKNDYERAFQRESCEWEKYEKCDFGCNKELNKCHTASINNVTMEPKKEITIPVRNPTIIQGQIVNLNGDNFSIYIIEQDRVKLKMNDQRSDWLNEGDSFTFRNGVKIGVIAILFQPYDGGKKDVIYRVS